MELNFMNKCLKYSTCVIACYIMVLVSYIWMGSRFQYETERLELDKVYINHTSFYKACSEKKSAYTFNKTCTKRFPNCLIIGAQKSGTRALLLFLAAHPQIVRNENLSEYHFFSWHYSLGLKWYKKHMPCSNPYQVVIEKSPSYFVTKEVPKRVYEMDSNIRLILIVRNPIERTISAYYMGKRMWRQRQNKIHQERNSKQNSNEHANTTFPSIESSWHKYIQQYDTNFENWLKFFPLKQIHIVDGDVLLRFPFDELRKIEEFLKIDHCFDETMFVLSSEKGFYCLRTPRFGENLTPNDLECLNAEKGHHHPIVSALVLQNMTALFRPHNKRFFKLSGRQFDWNR